MTTRHPIAALAVAALLTAGLLACAKPEAPVAETSQPAPLEPVTGSAEGPADNAMPVEPTDHGNTDHGNTDHGNTDHGNTDHGNTDHGNTDHGNTDHGNTDHGNTDHGNTDHGNTDHGNTDHGNTDH